MRFGIYTTFYGEKVSVRVLTKSGLIYQGRMLTVATPVEVAAPTAGRAIEMFLKLYYEDPESYTYNPEFNVWAELEENNHVKENDRYLL